MKLPFLILFSLGFSMQLYCQDTNEDIFANTNANFSEIIMINNLDVLSYFKIDDYSTELQQMVYKKSEEYQLKLAELKKLKELMLQTSYHGEIKYAFSESDYDVNRRGFEVGISSYSIVFSDGWANTTILNSIYLNNGGSRHPFYKKDEDIYTGSLFIPLDELAGLEIENNRDDIVFKPSFSQKPIIKFETEYIKFPGSKYAYSHVTSNEFQVVVLNRKTNRIYFNKIYIDKPPTLKKPNSSNIKKTP